MSNLIKANSIIGLPVITTVDGKNIHSVKEIIYDGRDNKVKAIVVDEKGWFHNAKIILIDDIQSIGTDAVLVYDSSMITDADDQNDDVISSIVNDDNFLTKNEVITEGGKKLGRVTDIYFNFPGGNVDAIEVSEGFIKNIRSGTKKVQISDIITIGENNLIVKEYAQDHFDEQGKNQGLNKFMSETKENVGNLTEIASDKTQEIVNSDLIKNAVQSTQEVANNLKTTVTDKYDQAKEHIQSDKLEKDLNSTFEKVKEKTGEIVDGTKQAVSDTSDQAVEEVLEKRIHNAIGKTIGGVLLLNKDDEIMASEGDIVTHQLIQQAKEVGNLDILLENIK